MSSSLGTSELHPAEREAPRVDLDPVPSAALAQEGSDAQRPRDIGLWGLVQVVRRVTKRVREDNLKVVAGGVAFWAFLAIFPAMAAVMAIWGFFADPEGIDGLITRVGIPDEGAQLLSVRMRELADISERRLRLGAVVSLLLALWLANTGTRSIFQALNIAYNESERRGFLRLLGTSMAVTLGLMVAAVIAAAAVIGVPLLLGELGLGQEARWVVRWLRWPLLAVMMLLGLAVFYRVGPSRQDAKWQWISPGAVLAIVAWIGGSLAFSAYVENFGDYDRTYGSLGAAAILLLWFFITALVVLVGAELNAELEHQTREDSTVGEPAPMGERGAYHADNVADGAQLDPAQRRAQPR